MTLARRLREDSCFKGDKVLQQQHNFEKCIITTITTIIITGSFLRTPTKLANNRAKGDRETEERKTEREAEKKENIPTHKALKEEEKFHSERGRLRGGDVLLGERRGEGTGAF